MRGFFSLLNRFRADERGVFAVIFGLLAIVLVAMAGAAVDYTSMEAARTKAQIALDSAALGLAPTIYDDPTPADLMAKAQALVIERLGDTNVTVKITSAVPVKNTGTLTLGGTIDVPMAFVQLVGVKSMTVGINSQTKKGSVNIEVGVALDVTGSMKDDIGALQTALASLISIVVQEQQVPTYSKMAIVPYSTAVKIDTSYIDSVRDPVTTTFKSVSSAVWWNSEKDISGATKAQPVVITQNGHGFSNNDVVAISGVKGMTQLNGKSYVVKNKTTNTFELYLTDGTTRVDGRNYNTYVADAGDKVRRCVLSTCEITITANGHGYAENDRVAFSDFSGYMTGLNDFSSQISNVTTNSFRLANTYGYSSTNFNQNGTAGTVTGKIWCTNVYGCKYLYKSSRLFKATPDCVVERMSNSFTDAKPSTKKFAIYYVEGGDCEVNQALQPLTSDLPTLNAFTATGGLTYGGGTAGQIGTAWAWYTVAPNFAEVFTGSSAPSAYKAANTRKFVIIMTDGEYNTEHCDGVHTYYAGCSAPDGTTGSMTGAFGQAEDICANMKKDTDITVYTVGFRLGTTGDDVDILKKCASDTSKAKLATDAAGLQKAFEEIGQELATLRLSQ
jgi:Flp pilus assembly protein TadG